uniref:GNAT family N-acetyltransferase n=1 Tax=Undibacterium sp. TaxID=1914977 RepID=UPI0037538529
GLCGLVKREELPSIDIGYAYLPEFGRQGYAYEANQGLLNYAKNSLHLEGLLAIVSLHNHASCQLLEKLGFQFQKNIVLKAGDTVKLFTCAL